jgi:hypothetical protein
MNLNQAASSSLESGLRTPPRCVDGGLAVAGRNGWARIDEFFAGVPGPGGAAAFSRGGSAGSGRR